MSFISDSLKLPFEFSFLLVSIYYLRRKYLFKKFQNVIFFPHTAKINENYRGLKNKKILIIKFEDFL